MFDIDPVSLGFALVLSLAFAAPFYLYNVKHKNSKKKNFQLLTDFANANGMQIDATEYWRDQYLIGLDKSSQKLIYLNIGSTPVLIDLNKIKQIQIREDIHEINVNDQIRKILNGLYLVFKTDLGQEQVIEFYDAEKFTDLNGEKPLIKKWHAELLLHIRKKHVQEA